MLFGRYAVSVGVSRGATLIASGMVSVLAVACSSPSGTGAHTSSTEVATPAEIQSTCESQCARSERCHPPAPGAVDAGLQCVPHCIDGLGNLANALRGDIARGLAACYDGLACGVNDDGCTSKAVFATGQNVDAAVHAPDVQACLRKNEECRNTAGSFSDDICGTLVMLVDSKRAEVSACFSGTCESVSPCLQPIKN